MFPNAEFETHCKNKYPLRITLHAKVVDNSGGEDGDAQDGDTTTKIMIWSGDQKRLFQKNAALRTECMKEIQGCLEDFKEKYS